MLQRLYLTVALLFWLPILFLSGCSGLELVGGSKQLGLTEQAFANIDAYYVDPPNYVKLRYGALSGLSKALPPGTLTVIENPDGTAIHYRSADNVNVEKILTSNSDKRRALTDIADAYRLARQISPSIDPQRLERAMLKSAIVSLDPQAELVEPEMYQEITQPVSMGGVGLEIAIREGRIIVVRPIEESPARKAGIAPGDRIESIDNIPVQGLSLVEVVRMLRGPRGSHVDVRIARDSWPESRTMTFERAVVRSRSVSFKFLEGDITLVSIGTFDSRTARDLDRVLNEVESRSSGGIILDLRYNGGGILDAAVAVVSRFLAPGVLVVSTVGRSKRESRSLLTTQSDHPISKLPLVIIADKSTSAGAEAVAAKMQEAKRALIVGSRTFGHSTIYEFLPLSDGSAIKLIVARWVTASGRSIGGVGLTPDIQVATEQVDHLVLGDPQRDECLQRAMKALRSGGQDKQDQ